MPIPEAQLETWSHQGSVTQSSSTYNTIKSVLENSTTPYAGKKFEVFLQGHSVEPVEWLDWKWIADSIGTKISLPEQ